MGEPFAMEIYRRYMEGKNIEQLSRELGIPVDRIEQRLRAAASLLARRHLSERLSA